MDDNDILRCQSCGWYTTRLEASARLFNTNRCARCAGPLQLYEKARTDQPTGDEHAGT